MKILLSPVRSDETLRLSCTGDILNVNGQDFDFTPLAEGCLLPSEAISSEWIVGTIYRLDGELVVNLRLPHGINPPDKVAFPEPLLVRSNGPVWLPTDEVSND